MRNIVDKLRILAERVTGVNEYPIDVNSEVNRLVDYVDSDNLRLEVKRFCQGDGWQKEGFLEKIAQSFASWVSSCWYLVTDKLPFKGTIPELDLSGSGDLAIFIPKPNEVKEVAFVIVYKATARFPFGGESETWGELEQARCVITSNLVEGINLIREWAKENVHHIITDENFNDLLSNERIELEFSIEDGGYGNAVLEAKCFVNGEENQARLLVGV